MVRGILFDMDGLMFATEQLSTEGWMKAASQLDYPITLDFIKKFRGTNIAYSRALFQREFGEQVDYDLARQIRTDSMNEHIEKNGVPIKEGLLELLDYLKDNGLKSAVATSTHQAIAEVYLKKAGVFDYFDVHVYGDGISKGKPDPEIFQVAAGMLALPTAECVVLEDSPNGIIAGDAAGCQVIAVPDITEIEENVMNKTTACCRDLREVIDWIKDNR